MRNFRSYRHESGFRWVVFLGVSLALFLGGCGGSGGGGGGSGGGDDGTPVDTSFGNSLPPSTGPGDVENFFPNAQGTSWNYFATVANPSAIAGAPPTYMNSVTVTGTKTIGGQTASVFLESNPSGSGIPLEGYYLKNAGGVAYLGNNNLADKITAGIVPHIVGLFPAAPGVVANFTKNGLDYGVDVDGDGVNETMNLTLTSATIGFEPLSIGVGSFARTVKNSETVTGSVVLSRLKTSIPLSSTSMRWLAPGLGILKISQSATVQSSTASVTMEARGYTSNGVAHGFGLPFTVAPNLAPGDSNFDTPGPPALATDGQNFLAASTNAAGLNGVLFDTQGAPISVHLRAGVGPVFPVAAFDGTHYWVLYTYGSLDTCLAQRVSPAGNLIDATAINLVTVGAGYSSITSKGFAFGIGNGLLAYSIYNLSTNQHELHGVLVNPGGTFSASFPIATDISTHLNPAVAFDGTNFFVAWTQLPTNAATAGSIYGVRVSPSGSVLDSAPTAIATAPNGQSSPSLAFDGSNYLVVWLDLRNQPSPPVVPYPDVYGARVSTAGVLLDGPSVSGGFVINGGGSLPRSSPRVAFSGAEYLVTWTVLGYAISGSPGVQAVRVSTAGTLPSGSNMAITVSGPPTAATVSQFVFPVIAAGPQRAAVVWLDNSELAGSQKSLLGVSFFPF